MSTISLLLSSAERFYGVRAKAQAWCDEAAKVWRRWRQKLFVRYRPESYYMRGPGPKWRERHLALPASKVKARDASSE